MPPGDGSRIEPLKLKEGKMSTEILKPVSIIARKSDGTDVSSVGEVLIEEYDHNDRVKRAAKAWIISWALAVASLPLIIAHWVLVPGFLIAGPFMARRYFRIESIPKKVSGACPIYGEEIAIKPESSDKLPMWTYCSPHRDPVHIVPVEDASWHHPLPQSEIWRGWFSPFLSC